MKTVDPHELPSPTLDFRPFSAEELATFRSLGSISERFEALAYAAMRLQVLQTFRGEVLDAAAKKGAALAEDVALAALANCPAPDRQALDLKADLFASRRVGPDNMMTMLEASIRADAARLDGHSTDHGAIAADTRRIKAVRRHNASDQVSYGPKVAPDRRDRGPRHDMRDLAAFPSSRRSP